MTESQFCGKCRFWNETDEFNLGYCQRFPPNIVKKPTSMDDEISVWKATIWPITLGSDKCGEFEIGKFEQNNSDEDDE